MLTGLVLIVLLIRPRDVANVNPEAPMVPGA
jgi:hypothetical protein